MKKRILASLLSLIVSCKTLTQNLTPIENNTKVENRIYRTGETNEDKKHSKKEAEQSACNEAKEEIAREISTEIRSRDIDIIKYKKDSSEQENNSDQVSLTSLTVNGLKTESLECKVEEELLLGLIRLNKSYSCKCTVSMPENIYEQAIEREVKRQEIELTGIKIPGVFPFTIDRLEVTEEEYAAYRRSENLGTYKTKCKNGKSNFDYEFDPESELIKNSRKPINCISQDEALAYCKSVSKDLPTLEEWIDSTGTSLDRRNYPWGNEEPTTVPPKVNFGKLNNLMIETIEVGTYKQSSRRSNKNK